MATTIDPNSGLEAFIKQPDESRVYTFEFAALLGANTVDTVVSVTGVNQGLVDGSAALTVGAGTDDNISKVQVRLSGGTDGEDYKIEATVTDSGTNTLQGEGMLQVRDL